MTLQFTFNVCIICFVVFFYQTVINEYNTTTNNGITNSYVATVVEAISSISTIDERYSYSLTTFNPNGQLGQVIRAQQASTYGVPIVCIIVENPDNTFERMIVMTSIQYLPSIFMIDDGTSRFVQLTDTIFISHSGIGADGRIVVAAAQRIVIEYEYTYNTNISIYNLLQQLSLLLQQYTMKPGTRPFGSLLLLAHLPNTNTNIDIEQQQQPTIYQIDVSGKIDSMNNKYNIINGKDFIQLTNTEENLSELIEDVASNIIPFDPIIIQQKVATILHEATIVLSNKIQSESIPSTQQQQQQQQQEEEITSIRNYNDNISTSTTSIDNDNNNDKTILEDIDDDDNNNKLSKKQLNDNETNSNDDTNGSIINQSRHTAILTACLRVRGSTNGSGKGTFTRKRWLYDEI